MNHRSTLSVFVSVLGLLSMMVLQGVHFLESDRAFAATASSNTNVGIQIHSPIPPSPPIYTVTVVNDYYAQFTGTTIPNGEVHLTYSDSFGHVWSPVIIADASGNWSYLTGLLNGGVYSSYANVVNTANHTTSANSATQSFTITLPTPAFEAQRHDGKSVSLYDGTGGLPNGIVRISISGPNGYSQTVDVTADASGNWSYITERLASGDYTFTARVVDGNGTLGPVSQSRTVNIPGGGGGDGGGGGGGNGGGGGGTTTNVVPPTGGGTKDDDDKKDDDKKDGDTTDSGDQPPGTTDDGGGIVTPPRKDGDGGLMETEEETGLMPIIASIATTLGELGSAFVRLVQDHTGKFAFATLLFGIISAMPFFFYLTGIKDLLYLGQSIFFDIMNFFAFLGKKREFGIVYSSHSGSPLALARIHLFDQYNRKVETRMTDSSGMYSFLVSPGKYALAAEKEGYTIDITNEHPALYSGTYHGEVLEYDGKYGNIKVDIAMLPLAEVDENPRFSPNVYRFFDSLFWFGVAANIVFFIIEPSWLFAWVILGYVLLHLVKRWYGQKPVWGTIVGPDGKGKPFSILRIFKSDTNEFVAQATTDEIGRYILILNPGSYSIQAVGIDGTRWSGTVSVRGKRKVFKEKILLG